MIMCGLISLAATGLAREAARGFDGAPAAARVNVLVLGIDQRAGMTDPARTDTMLLFTLDRQARTAGMLSINRDLWVKIPGGQREGKINTAHFLGEVEAVFGIWVVPLFIVMSVKFGKLAAALPIPEH